MDYSKVSKITTFIVADLLAGDPTQLSIIFYKGYRVKNNSNKINML